jgi:MFS family permease
MFYGWRIVAVTLLTGFASVGFLFYSYGVFFKALAAEFGGSRLGVAVGLAILNAVAAVFAPLLGRLLDRGSVRVIMCAGALWMALGFVLASRIADLWQLYVLLAVFLATGSAMLGGISGSTLVANWFSARRGTALGLSAMGVSLSGMVMAPAATWLIGEIGWRSTYLLYAAATVLVVVPPVWWIVVDRPEQLGLAPDGVRDPSPAPPDPPAPVLPLAPGDQLTDHAPGFEWSARASLGERNFWAISMTVALNFCASGAVLTHIIPHATDIGIEPLRAAYVLSAIAGMGVIGKATFGWLVDRIHERAAVWLSIALQAGGLFMLLGTLEYRLLLLWGGVFGLGMGGMVPMFGALVGAAFGRHAFGRVMGLMSPVMVPVQSLGIPFAGWMFDRTGAYDRAFAVLLGVYGLAMLAVALLRLPESEPTGNGNG